MGKKKERQGNVDLVTIHDLSKAKCLLETHHDS